MRIVECFELCEISHQIQCLYCVTYWTEGIVYCACGTCLVPTDATRKLNREGEIRHIDSPSLHNQEGRELRCSSWYISSATGILSSAFMLEKGAREPFFNVFKDEKLIETRS